MGFAQFMSSGLGRGSRIVAGIILVAMGLGLVGGTSGIVLAVVGLVPLLAGLLDVCLIGALFGAPLKGADVRVHAKS